MRYFIFTYYYPYHIHILYNIRDYVQHTITHVYIFTSTYIHTIYIYIINNFVVVIVVMFAIDCEIFHQIRTITFLLRFLYYASDV